MELNDKDSPYDYQWLFERLTEVRMADKVLPYYRFGEEDPEEIKNVKNKLCEIKADLEYLELKIYNLMENSEIKNV